MARSSSGGSILCTSGFVDYIMYAHNYDTIRDAIYRAPKS